MVRSRLSRHSDRPSDRGFNLDEFKNFPVLMSRLLILSACVVTLVQLYAKTEWAKPIPSTIDLAGQTQTTPDAPAVADPSVDSALSPVNHAQIVRSPQSRPVSLLYRHIAGVPVYIATIDLQDPHTFLSIGLAKQATQANSSRRSRGDESFVQMVRRHRAALTLSGTFFSMDSQKRVMGNMVAEGRFLKFSPWENYGTTLGLRAGNQPEMITARLEGKPRWQEHWFSITAGPRLLNQGQIQIQPKREGFTDPAVMGSAVRSAIGFPRSGKQLVHVTFLKPVSLQREAEIMQYVGCAEAMNLDGGTSLAIAKGNRILKSAGRGLTNVITVYDVEHPAPQALQRSWQAFQSREMVALETVDGVLQGRSIHKMQ